MKSTQVDGFLRPALSPPRAALDAACNPQGGVAVRSSILASTLLVGAALAMPAYAAGHKAQAANDGSSVPASFKYWTTEHSSKTNGTVTINGRHVRYEAVAGTIVLKNKKHQPAASMFYVAYFKRGVRNPADRPVTFFYNGGPGSSSMWLHMGAFGPKRIDTTPAPHHTHAAPYKLVNNQYSLLNATDEVFIDAPATGFSRILPDGNGKNFFGIDQDGAAFAKFITRFLSKYDRWNSPKYLFGESYGTTRNSVLAWDLEHGKNVDLNGVIMLSAILNFDTGIDSPAMNPGVNLPYELGLPTYAATSWYHKQLPPKTQGMKLDDLLKQVEHFAMNGYAHALIQGNTLSDSDKRAVAEKLHQYTGLSVNYLMKANLRVGGGEYEHQVMNGQDTTTGRLDTRFTGPSMDPLAKRSYYDPQSASISSAYVAAFNSYVRDTLKFGKGHHYRPVYYGHLNWKFKNVAPFHGRPQTTPNVMLNLAAAMKYNPKLKVMVNGGYYDLATPFYAAWYQFEQMPIPPSIQKNISFHWYKSGHMVYVHKPSLKAIHANVTKFIENSDNE